MNCCHSLRFLERGFIKTGIRIGECSGLDQSDLGIVGIMAVNSTYDAWMRFAAYVCRLKVLVSVSRWLLGFQLNNINGFNVSILNNIFASSVSDSSNAPCNALQCNALINSLM